MQGIDLGPALENEVLEFWRERKVFEQTLQQSSGGPLYTWNEGPPTANGKPGIHHVLARSFKDLYPRYKTMRGYHVPRKAGWDTHGLPVEHEIEKELGIFDKKDTLLESSPKCTWSECCSPMGPSVIDARTTFPMTESVFRTLGRSGR